MALPALRPLAFRTRRYLTQGVQDELVSLKVAIRNEAQQAQAELLHEIRHTHASALEALQRIAVSVQHEVLSNAHHWYVTEREEAQASFSDLHQAIQFARESVRDDVLRTALTTTAELHQAFTDKSNKQSEAHNHQLEAHAASTFTRLDRIEHLGHIAARRTAVHAENGVVLVKAEVGYVLCSDSDHAVLACLLETGELEFGTRVLIERFLKPGDVFVDVGAHLGLMSLAAARALRGEGQIFAFEPFPQTRNLLERSVWINGLTPMIQIGAEAVSNISGETTLFLGANSGHHSIFALDLPAGYPPQQITVPTVTLDEALPSNQKVALIKIDAEGAEMRVIQGARSIDANNPDMAYIVEFGPSHLKRVGHSIEQWLAAFTDLGLTYKAISLETGALEDISVDQLAAADSVNLFFARPGSSAWARLD